jgi:hypothetical protein
MDPEALAAAALPLGSRRANRSHSKSVLWAPDTLTEATAAICPKIAFGKL